MHGSIFLSIIIVSVLVLSSCFIIVRPVLAFSYVNVSVQEAKTMIDSMPSLVILDVRNQSEYDLGHIRNALLIPVWNLTENLGQLSNSDTILVYCKAGTRSTMASETLVANGYASVYNTIGGINAWTEAGYPKYIKYSSIQEAVNNATENQILLISTGFYFEHLKLDKPLTLLGENRFTTVIDGNNSGTILDINADNITVSDITVEKPGCICDGDYGILIEGNYSGITLINNELLTDSVGINATNAHDIVIAYNNFSEDYVASITISNCSNFQITGNNMTGFMQGVEITGCTNITFSNNVLSGSGEGVLVEDSDGNIFFGNQFLHDSCGISLHQSNDNLIYHNSFKDNFRDASSLQSLNQWDNGAEGNYWENCTGTDANSDGIGDASYTYGTDGNITDHHPLMGMFSVYKTNDLEVNLVSNSTLTDFSFGTFNSTEGTLSFSVDGPSGTQGFSRVCLPNTLINGTITATIDGQPIADPQMRILNSSNANCTYIYLSYTHSLHTIQITGTTNIPEFHSGAFAMIFMLLLLPAVAVRNAWFRRKRQLTNGRSARFPF